MGRNHRIDWTFGQTKQMTLDLTAHKNNFLNPHQVSALQVGAAPASHLLDYLNPHQVSLAQVGGAPASHLTNYLNPHQVTIAQVGGVPAAHLTDYANPHQTKSTNLNDMPRYEDVAVDGARARGAGPNQPDWLKFKDNGLGSNGVYGWSFTNTTLKELFFSAQFFHAIKIGSTVNFHVHISKPNSNAGNIALGLEYTFANINGTFSNTSVVEEIVNIGTPAQDVHAIAPLSALPIPNVNISHVIICRVFRNGSNILDNYEFPVWFHSFDFHVQIDSIGSAQIGSKT